MVRVAASILVLLPSFQTAAFAQESLESGKPLSIELAPDDAPLEGHGAARDLHYTTKGSGWIYVYASSGACDPFLRIERSGGDLVGEDDNSGGGKTAFLDREVSKGDEFWVRVACAHEKECGAVRVRLTEVAKLAPEHRATLNACSALIRESETARASGTWNEARAKAKQAGEELLAIPAPTSREVCEALFAAGLASWNAQDAASAGLSWGRVHEFVLAVYPDEHAVLQTARQNLAVTKRALGDVKGELELERKVLEVRSRNLPDDHPQVQSARLNLAMTLGQIGDLQGERDLEEKVVEVFTRTLPPDDHVLQVARLNLSATRTQMGDVRGALELQEKVLDVFKRKLPDDDPQVQIARRDLAITKSALGDLRGALELDEKAYEVSSRVLPEDSADLLDTRIDLALTLEALGDRRRASSLLEQVLEVRSRTLPDDHPDLLAIRTNAASVRRDLGDVDGAFELETQVLEILARKLPEDHPDLLRAQINLAVTEGDRGNLRRERELEEKVLEMRRRRLPSDDPDVASALRVLCITLAELGEKARSEKLLAELAESWIGRLARWRLEISPRALSELAASASRDLDWLLSLSPTGSRELESAAVRWMESARTAEVTALATSRVARAAADPERLAALEAEVARAGAEIATAGRGDPGRFLAANDAKERAQTEVQRYLASLPRVQSRYPPVQTEAIASALRPDEAAVGFWRYSRIDSDASARSRKLESQGDRFVAFLLRRGEPPQRVELGPAEAIEQAIDRWREDIGARAARGAGAIEAVDRRTPAAETEQGALLRGLLLDPLLPRLAGVQRLIVALDDCLLLVPFDALPTADGKRVGDRYRIVTRATLRDLLVARDPPSGPECILALGGVDYDAAAPPSSGSAASTVLGRSLPPPSAGAATQVSAAASTRGLPVELVRAGAASAPRFVKLGSTGPEAAEVASCFSGSHGEAPPPIILSGAEATRTAVLEQAPRVRFLHLATHGYFAPESIPSLADSDSIREHGAFSSLLSHEQRVNGFAPMLLCGLVLAGANLPPDEHGAVPGILTAEEIALMDLSNCELAVLSACQTNVGRLRRAGQGIASLQQALHAAGARTAITSLWSVPDEATRELMIDFYQRIWKLKIPKAQALWEAKCKLRQQRNPDGSPKYEIRDWAAWVLSGDPD